MKGSRPPIQRFEDIESGEYHTINRGDKSVTISHRVGDDSVDKDNWFVWQAGEFVSGPIKEFNAALVAARMFL